MTEPLPLPSLSDSKAQVTALQLIVGSLQRCTVFGNENRAALVHKATGYSAKLLKKPDQCRAVYMCAHLFWHDTVQELCDAASVLQCLKRALKIANAAQVRSTRVAASYPTSASDLVNASCAMQQMAGSARDAGPAGLFIEILNKCVQRKVGTAPCVSQPPLLTPARALVMQIPVLLRQGLREHHGRGAAQPAAAGGGRGQPGVGTAGAGLLPPGHTGPLPRTEGKRGRHRRALRGPDRLRLQTVSAEIIA